MDSNHRRARLQRTALPTELSRLIFLQLLAQLVVLPQAFRQAPRQRRVDPVEPLGDQEAGAQLADDLALPLHGLDPEAAAVARRTDLGAADRQRIVDPAADHAGTRLKLGGGFHHGRSSPSSWM